MAEFADNGQAHSALEGEFTVAETVDTGEQVSSSDVATRDSKPTESGTTRSFEDPAKAAALARSIFGLRNGPRQPSLNPRRTLDPRDHDAEGRELLGIKPRRSVGS